MKTNVVLYEQQDGSFLITRAYDCLVLEQITRNQAIVLSFGGQYNVVRVVKNDGSQHVL